MLEFLVGAALGAGIGYSAGYQHGYRDGQGPGQCHSTTTFAGGEDQWRCRLTAGHAGAHRGLRVGIGGRDA